MTEAVEAEGMAATAVAAETGAGMAVVTVTAAMVAVTAAEGAMAAAIPLPPMLVVLQAPEAVTVEGRMPAARQAA